MSINFISNFRVDIPTQLGAVGGTIQLKIYPYLYNFPNARLSIPGSLDLTREEASELLNTLKAFVEDGHFGSLEPKKKYRPFNAVEAAAHLGLEFVSKKGFIYTLAEIGNQYVKLSSEERDGFIIDFVRFLEDFKFVDSQMPAGVEEENEETTGE